MKEEFRLPAVSPGRPAMSSALPGIVIGAFMGLLVLATVARARLS
jgi:hypothetical protein